MTERPDPLNPHFEGLRVVVVGDVMLDRYILGRVRRISPEAPVPVVDVERCFERPGGAGNVAANLTRLGATTTLICAVGDDGDGRVLEQALSDHGLTARPPIVAAGAPTTVKTRVVAQNQQVVRFDREMPLSIGTSLASTILGAFADVEWPNVVVLSDYAKGVLTATVCQEIIGACRSRGVPVVVDPKGRDYRKYGGATCITPNQSEAALAVGTSADEDLSFESLARYFFDTLDIQSAVVTRGELGATVLHPSHPPTHLPATALEVADVTGAGDTFVGTYALAIAAGHTCLEAAELANIAAGVAIGRLGAATVSRDELLEALQNKATRLDRRLSR